MGGLVIGGAAEKIPQRIRRLVYLDEEHHNTIRVHLYMEPGLVTIYKERALSGSRQKNGWLPHTNRKNLA